MGVRYAIGYLPNRFTEDTDRVEDATQVTAPAYTLKVIPKAPRSPPPGLLGRPPEEALGGSPGP
jgi:hypothetical protein